MGKRSSWNAGNLKTSQHGVHPGYKRCSTQVDPRCQRVQGVQPIDGYRIVQKLVTLDHPNHQMAACKWCESYAAYARTRRPGKIDAHREYQRTYQRNKRKEKNQMLKLDKGFQIIFDPLRIYPRSSIFKRSDFRKSLKDCIWPKDMIVKDLLTNLYFQVNIVDLIEVADRDWFEYRNKIVNGED